MSSQLHQAVGLAQAGQTEQARQMLRQVVQAEPNNEVAWLWLASVAADQPEYVRALNAVLRINPNNQQAQQLLADFQQQYGSPPPGEALAPLPPPARVEPRSSPPPPAAPYQSQPPSTPPPQPEQRGFSSVFPSPSSPPSAYQQPDVPPVSEPPRRKRGCSGCFILPGLPGCGGCGCVPSCFVILIALVILPVVICGGVTYAGLSLGPFDIVAGYLPDQFGRKTTTFEADNMEFTLEVPRSWYLAERDNAWWEVARGLLDEILPFADPNATWSEYEAVPGEGRTFLETNPEVLRSAGDLISLQFTGMVEGDFTCQAGRAQDGTVTEYENGLCGTRSFAVEDQPQLEIFDGRAAPTQVRTITFQVPVDGTTAAQFEIRLPELQVADFEDDIDKLIESVEITRL
jgi:hypothetical protein